MSDAPALTVTVATYNGRELLEVALRSIEAQRFRDFTTVVVDDGSTDDTVDWLREHWPQVRVISQPNAGVTAALNACLHRGRDRVRRPLQQRHRDGPGLPRRAGGRPAWPPRGRLGGRQAARLRPPRGHRRRRGRPALAWQRSPTRSRRARSWPVRAAPRDLRGLRWRGRLSPGGSARCRAVRPGLLCDVRGRRLVAARPARRLDLPLRAERDRLPHGQRHDRGRPDRLLPLPAVAQHDLDARQGTAGQLAGASRAAAVARSADQSRLGRPRPQAGNLGSRVEGRAARNAAGARPAPRDPGAPGASLRVELEQRIGPDG